MSLKKALSPQRLNTNRWGLEIVDFLPGYTLMKPIWYSSAHGVWTDGCICVSCEHALFAFRRSLDCVDCFAQSIIGLLKVDPFSLRRALRLSDSADDPKT